MMEFFTERLEGPDSSEVSGTNRESERPERCPQQPEKYGCTESVKSYADSKRPAEGGPQRLEKADAEYDKNGTRELSLDEKQQLKDKLGWPDKKIEDNCRIDEKGTIHYKTDCQGMEGCRSACGVLYERRTVEYRGVRIEGVFPVFGSVFDTKLPEKNYQSSNFCQFRESNRNLKEAVDKDPELRKTFTPEQRADIRNGDTPRGYTWHHSEEPGRMQLVKTEEHDKRIGGAAHTGGNSIWGNKSVERAANDGEKGVSF